MSFLRRSRAWLYDAVIVSMTADWYSAVIDLLPPNSTLLDVGIGTGGALIANVERLRTRHVRVIGIDIDADYVAQCRRAIAAAGAADHVSAALESVYDHRGGPYDAVYFSASFMLLPDPSRALRHVAALLRAGGRIYFTQTFEHERSAALEVLKPLLRWVTTIDFGRVTYERDFDAALSAADMTLLQRRTLHAGRRRSSVLSIAEPKTQRAGDAPGAT